MSEEPSGYVYAPSTTSAFTEPPYCNKTGFDELARLREENEKLREALEQIKTGAENQGPFTGMSWLQVREICGSALEYQNGKSLGCQADRIAKGDPVSASPLQSDGMGEAKRYPLILNGDHAEFEAEWIGKDPKDRPDWPLPSFDAKDWAEEFCRIAKQQGHDIDEGWMIGWFANALMRGFDEGTSRAQSQLEGRSDEVTAAGGEAGLTPKDSSDV